MTNVNKNIQVSHVNIRLSISFLLLKLFLVEIITATGVILFLSVSLTDFITDLGFQLPFFSIPIYLILVIIKTALTAFIILQWLNEYYEITLNSITHRRGILFRYEEKYPIEHILYVEFSQGLFGRIFNFGTITLLDVRHAILLKMYQIHNPRRYATIIENQIGNEVERINIFREHLIEPEDVPLTVN